MDNALWSLDFIAATQVSISTFLLDYVILLKFTPAKNIAINLR